MSAPPFNPFQQPLSQGWSEHTGPNGQPYYYNALTRESTYVRPVQVNPTAQTDLSKKKEKPLLKTPIPGTDWIRVTTTDGNIFYSHKIRKESVWTVPEELKEALDSFISQEKVGSSASSDKSTVAKADAKRKAEEAVPLDEIVVSKKARIEDEEDDDADDDDSDEDEEEWQRKAAEQLAAEAAEEKRRKAEEKKAAELEAQRAFSTAEIAMPQKVDLSLEEGKALFKTLLREKDINPLHPWDMSLPKFVSDPRYVLLPSVAARREAFDEYCKERARELRQSSVKKEKDAIDPKEDFERLLKEEVTSTRASWTEFKRIWKKDRRFYGWGRDEREREKRFRDYLKELGEKKRQAVQRVEADFFALLKETKDVKESSSWKEIKKGIYKDPRYDAVGSSSLREELFNTFLKGKSGGSRAGDQPTSSPSIDVKTSANAIDHEDRKKRAVREREEKITAERRQLNVAIERSKLSINQEEGERIFMTLLTDAIRDPQIKWEQALPELKTDPRFTNSPLPANQQVHLFHAHVGQLRAKQMDNLHSVFLANAPSLATRFSELSLQSILSSAPASRLGFDTEILEDEFRKWQRERTTAARKAFDDMLTENAFVDFWGRLGKMGENVVGSGVKMDDDDIGEVGEEKVDMKVLAKNIDIGEMEKVLKHDKRYIMFDHVPEQREQWIRDYIAQLSAPKRSVHTG